MQRSSTRQPKASESKLKQPSAANVAKDDKKTDKAKKEPPKTGKKAIDFQLPPLSIVGKKKEIDFEEIRRKVIRRGNPEGEDKKQLASILKHLKESKAKIRVHEFVNLVAKHTSDNGEVMRKVMEEDLAAFRKMVTKVYENMTQDVSDVLVNEQIQTANFYQERYDMFNSRTLWMVSEIFQMIPDFEFERFAKDKEDYLKFACPLPALIQRTVEDVDSQKRQEAFHRLQWLKIEEGRLAEENRRLEDRLNDLKDLLKKETNEATLKSIIMEQKMHDLEEEEREKQDHLNELEGLLGKNIVRTEAYIRLEEDEAIRVAKPPSTDEPVKKPKRKIVRKKDDWPERTARQIEQQAAKKVVVAESARADEKKRLRKREREPGRESTLLAEPPAKEYPEFPSASVMQERNIQQVTTTVQEKRKRPPVPRAGNLPRSLSTAQPRGGGCRGGCRRYTEMYRFGDKKSGDAESKDVETGELKKSKKKDTDDLPKKPGRPYPGFRKNFYDYFAEYSNNTGIHGFKYMGDQEMTVFERLWWLVLFCISLYICINLIIQTYIKWDTSPVLVSFARSPTPVWQVPFPAVTVCSETKSRQSVYNFTDYYHKMIEGGANMTEEDKKKFYDLALVCESHLFPKGNETTNYDTIEFLMSIAPQFDEMLWTCKYTLLNGSCHDFFTPILTEEGLCYTFNMLDRTELLRNKVFLPGNYMSHGRKSEGWNLEEGYPANAPINTYPRRAMSAGFTSGFLLLMRAYQQDLDFVCRGPVQGFKILLHNPAEMPRVGTQYFRAPLNQEVVVAVKPDMMTTSDGLRDYDPHRRECYFPKERHLAFYQSYTQQNCEIECLTNFTRRKCGCVAYHMPHEEGTPICGSGSIYCMFNAQNELLRSEVQSGLKRDEFDDEGPEEFDCDCLPGCTSLVYNAETSQADFMWENLFQAFKANMSEFPGVQMTRISIFFKEQQFITSERNELYGQTDFLANCGGILGLFTGFSFLSIVEVVYFLSLKLICNVKRYGRHYWSGSPQLLNNDLYVHKK